MNTNIFINGDLYATFFEGQSAHMHILHAVINDIPRPVGYVRRLGPNTFAGFAYQSGEAHPCEDAQATTILAHYFALNA